MIKLSFEPEFDYSAAEYRDLYTSAVFPTAFQHPLWLATIYQELVPAFKAEALTITGRNTSDNQLVFVLPLIRKRKYGITIVEIADFGVTDYCAPVIRKGLEAEIGANAQLASELLQKTGRNDIFRIKAVRPEHMQTIANLTGLPHQAAPVCSHELTLCQPFENFRCKTFSKSHRQQIDYAKRRLERLGNVSFRRLTDAREASHAIVELKSLRAGRFEKDPLANTDVLRFYSTIADKGAKNGFALTHKLEQDGSLVGISFGIADAGRYHGILIGCDYEKYRRCSPGFLLHDMIMADCATTNETTFDFNIGSADYKEKFGTTAVPIYRFLEAKSVAGRAACGATAVRHQLSSALVQKGNPAMDTRMRA